MSLQALPADLIKPVLEQLVSRVDLCNCALVSQEFHRTAAAVLYRNLEIRNVVVVSVCISMPSSVCNDDRSEGNRLW